jgi:clan AA aspartic protease
MIAGEVHPNGEATVRIRLRGPNTTLENVVVVVDTGFNDWLTLPAEAIDTLGLTWREKMTYNLADGSEVQTHIFEAEIEWLGNWRRIFVTEIEGGSLLGMAMLRGCYLGMEAIDGGRVEVRSLPG